MKLRQARKILNSRRAFAAVGGGCLRRESCMVDVPRGKRNRKKKPRQPGWRTFIARGEFIPVVVRTKGGDITIRFGVAEDGNHVIDAPKSCCDIIAPDRRPKKA